MTETTFTHTDAGQTLAAIDASQCVMIYSPDGRIVAANSRALALCGFAREDLIGRPHSILVDPNDRDEAAAAEFWARLRAGETTVGEYRRMAQNGAPFWISAMHAPVRGSDGSVAQVVMCGIDITASRSDEQVARSKLNALDRAQALIEFSPRGEILHANDNFLALLGYRLEECVGRHHRMFIPPAETNLEQSVEFWAQLAQGQNRTGEFKRVRQDGTPVWINGSYAPVRDDKGRIVSVIKLALDVSARRMALDELVEGLAALAGADLTFRMAKGTDDEFTQVRAKFNTMLAAMRELVGEVRSRTNAMNTEAEAIALAAGELARRGEGQAASMEQTAAAVDQISGNISMTSQSAREADAAARNALQVVLKGADVVAQAIAAIERIDEHTKRMGEFTRVIEGFAFQTNLLSINAAVEAARAGEVGRGFAVVANEVRNLAQQSAKASQNIADLIGKSETDVRAGVKLVRDAGTSLDQIQSAVGGVVQNITGIAHATTEQSHGVREVSEALSQLDRVNQANLSMSEQYAAAAGALSTQVEELGQMMDMFRTSDTVPPARHATLADTRPHDPRTSNPSLSDPRLSDPRRPEGRAA